MSAALEPMPEHYTPEERERQAALNASWAASRRDMADPVRRAELEAAIAEVDARQPAPRLTREEFLAYALAEGDTL